MTEVTIDYLRELMRACAGEDESGRFDGDIAETKFIDLGYDSLALLETAARIKREYGVEIADDEIGDIETPGALIEHVNHKLAA